MNKKFYRDRDEDNKIFLSLIKFWILNFNK